MDLSSLSPQDQQSFLALLGQQNQQSMDPSAFGVQPQPAAPSAPAQPPASIQQQDGDKMHPMDAINQIGNQMLPASAAPAGSELATGPQITQTKDGLAMRLPADHPLLRAMGIHHTVPISDPNYYSAAKTSDVLKYLGNGLARMPDGTPFVGKSMLEMGLQAKKAAGSASNPSYTQEEAVALFPDQASKLNKYFSKVPQGASIPLATIRSQIGEMAAGARVANVGVARNRLEAGLNTQFAKAISDSEQNQSSPLGISANILGQAFALRQGIATRYNPDTDNYDMSPSEVGDLVLSTARMLVRKGQLTNEQLDQINQQTAKGQVGKAMTYMTGTPFQGSTQDVIRRTLQIVDKEGLANEQLRNMYARQNLSIGEPLRQMNEALYNKTLNNSFGGVNYSQLLQDSPDTKSQNYLVPNITPLSQSSPLPGLAQNAPRGVPAPKPQSTGTWKVVGRH